MTPNGKIRGIVVHHTASDRDTTTYETIRHEHVDVNGWQDVGYHHLILSDGTLKVCRPVGQMGAHALGYNQGTIGIALAGNFEHEDPTTAQLRTLIQVLAVLCKRYGLPSSAIIGHCDVNRIVKFAKLAGRWVSTATACPGRILYRMLGAICRDVDGYLVAAKKGA